MGPRAPNPLTDTGLRANCSCVLLMDDPAEHEARRARLRRGEALDDYQA